MVMTPEEQKMMGNAQAGQPRGGLLGLFDKAMKTDDDTGLSPLQNFAAALDPLIMKDMRGGEGIRKQGAQRATSISKNKTVDMLRKQGRNDLADAVMNGTIGAKEAFSVMQSEKSADTAFQRQKDLAAYQAGLKGPAAPKSYEFQAVAQALMSANPNLSSEEALNMALSKGPVTPKSYEFQAVVNDLIAANPDMSRSDALEMALSKNKSNVNINTGDNSNYAYGSKAGLPAGWRIDNRTGVASVIPEGPADIDSAASAEAGDAKTQDQYEKDLTFFATGNKILDAINEKTFIPATGTAAAAWSAVPGLGQFQKDVQEDFAQLQAQLQMDALQTLRETSKNGSSGLGQLTDAERTAIGKVTNNLTNLKSEAAAATSVRSAMLLKAYFEGGLFDPSINGYRIASESELSAMVNGVNPFGSSEGPQITSAFNQFLPKYVAPQETNSVGLTQQQLMEKYK